MTRDTKQTITLILMWSVASLVVEALLGLSLYIAITVATS